MATLAAGNVISLGEAGNRVHNDKHVDVAMTLSEVNPILRHALFIESTDMFSHYHAQNLKLPTVGFRKFNAGVATSAGLTKPVYEPILELRGESEPDAKIVERQPDPVAFREGEDRNFIEAMGQEFEDKLFYGDHAANPEAPDGLANRYNVPFVPPSTGQRNVGDNGDTGTGASASLWIFNHDSNHGIVMAYPNGTDIGIDVEDHGKVRKDDASNNPLWVYATSYMLEFALVVRDDRGVQRLGSIDPVAGQSADLDVNNILDRLTQMWEGFDQRLAIYCNRSVYGQIKRDAINKTNVYYMDDSPYGDGRQPHIEGVPVYIAEGLVDAEDAI